MQTRLIDNLRDAAGDALELFRDKVDEKATEIDLIAALLHRGYGYSEDVLKAAQSRYACQLFASPVIDLGGTKRD